MPSQVALSSVFRLVLKILCSTFNYLYLFERIFLQVQVVRFSFSNDFHLKIFIFLLCVFMLHFRGSFSQNNNNKKKTSGVIIFWSGLEKVSFIFYWKEVIENSLIKH